TAKIEQDFPSLNASDLETLSALRGIYGTWMNAMPNAAWKSGTSPDNAQGHRAGGL
ncbi:hypothetical protein C8Q74DRAFT_1157479, partial [Fomes fomentarius]